MRNGTRICLIALLIALGLPTGPMQATADPAARGPYAIGTVTLAVPHPLLGAAVDTLRIVIWYPAAAQESPDAAADARLAPPIGKMPVLAFSHGACTTPDDYTWFITHLASYGWLIVAPQHAHSYLTPDKQCATDAAKAWSVQLRPGEMRAALDMILALNHKTGSVWEGHINADQIAAAGHSLGGQTVLQLTSLDSRIDSVIAMSPVIPPNKVLNAATRPTLIEGGAQDTVLNPGAFASSYERLPGPRYYLLLPSGNHSSWGNVCKWDVNCDSPYIASNRQAHPIILRTTLAFLYHYTLNDSRFDSYLSPKTDTLYELRADP
ncbi:MAG: hypothetical protein IT324_23445 [Anaerolineae bacterium]|nr:hypothetical protein [Anaerolineae bacterium]